MKRSAILLALPLTFRAAIAQTQPPTTAPSQAESRPNSSESSAEHIYGRKDHVKPPRAIYDPDPDYPKEARKAGKEGVVVLWLIVGSDGLPRDIKIARSLSPALDAAAVNAVKKWRFAPATKDGKPVAVQINVEINFRL